jgi:hypothetical protein
MWNGCKDIHLLGEEVMTLFDGILQPGLHSILWDGKDFQLSGSSGRYAKNNGFD